MPIRFKWIFGLALLFLLGAANSQQKQQFALLETGDFHGSDVSLSQPLHWLGVYCKKQECSARPTWIKAARTHDEVVDEDSKASTGTTISLAGSGSESPLFLVRGVGFTTRVIPTYFFGEQALQAGDRFSIGPASAGLTLRVDAKKTAEAALPKGSRLILARGSHEQSLFSLPKGGNDPYITVLWVGDLDGDGKPDFLLNTSWHYNISHKVLWLSSQAKPGEIVGLAAFFETTGC
jgi:hypothetical protein